MTEMDKELTNQLPSRTKLQELLSATRDQRVVRFAANHLPEEFSKWPALSVPELVS